MKMRQFHRVSKFVNIGSQGNDISRRRRRSYVCAFLLRLLLESKCFVRIVTSSISVFLFTKTAWIQRCNLETEVSLKYKMFSTTSVCLIWF